MKDKIEQYIQDRRKLGYEDEDTRKKMDEACLSRSSVDDAFSNLEKRKHPMLKVVVILLLLALLVVPAYFYFSYVAPVFVEKPDIRSPLAGMTDEQLKEMAGSPGMIEISEDHVGYLANELGAYKLHEDPFTDEPAKIEFLLHDTGQVFTVTVLENIPQASEGSSGSADIRITTDGTHMLELMAAEDFSSKAIELVQMQKIGIEIFSDEKTLALKGYKSIYDALKKDSGMPTGQFTVAFDDKLIWYA